MKFGELPFVVALGIVAAIALAGLAVVFFSGHRELVLLPFLAAVIFAAVYLYASHVPEPEAPPVAPGDEPFDDPVEEADRRSSSTGEPLGVEGDLPPGEPAMAADGTAPEPIGVPRSADDAGAPHPVDRPSVGNDP